MRAFQRLEKEREGKRREMSSPGTDFDIAKTGRRDTAARDADGRCRTALGLALRCTIEEEIRRRPVAEEGLHVARWVE